MTLERERRLQTFQRKMLRKVLGLGRARKVRAAETNKGADEESSITGSSDASEGEGSQDGSEGVVEEPWIEWLERTARAIGAQIKKGAVSDWVEQQRVRKWRWAGHVSRRKDGRWATRMLHWIPHGGERRRGRPATRWEDAIEAYAHEHGQKWEAWAEDKNAWRKGEAGFANRATVRGGGYPK